MHRVSPTLSHGACLTERAAQTSFATEIVTHVVVKSVFSFKFKHHALLYVVYTQYRSYKNIVISYENFPSTEKSKTREFFL
jgi:hypothetical protein